LIFCSEREPYDVYALNTHGLLLERLKLYNTAAKQFSAALKLSEDEERDMISINLARILIQIEKYEEAVVLCKQVKCANFNSQCHLALSLFKGMEILEIILLKYNFQNGLQFILCSFTYNFQSIYLQFSNQSFYKIEI